MSSFPTGSPWRSSASASGTATLPQGSCSTASRGRSRRRRRSTRCSTRSGASLDVVLFFDLDDATATERLLGRARAEARDDDTPAVIERRLAVYHEQTEPVIERYRDRGLLVRLPAEQTIDEVAALIAETLDRSAVR